MINIINAIMGSGKTTTIFNKIQRKEIPLPVIYITPYLYEAGNGNATGRIQEELKDFNFIAPDNLPNKTKHTELLTLQGENIACTHKLLGNFTAAIINNLKKNNYTIVIDEAISAFNEIQLKQWDLKLLVEGRHLSIHNTKELIWNHDSEYDGKLNYIKNPCKLGTAFLSSVGNNAIIWEYPIALFSSGLDIWIMTYPFDGTLMKSYLDIHKIPYQLINNKDLGLRDEKEIIEEIIPLLEIYDGKANSIGENKYGLSSSNLKKSNSHIQLFRSMYNVFHNIWKCESSKIIWTSFKSAQEKGAPNGLAKRFVPCNLRATNDYKDCTHIMYGVNIFMNPEITKHIKFRGGTFDQDQYALGEMLQLLWRGSIRNGQPMKVFIPSFRMRNLLIGWLNKYNPQDQAA